MYKALSAVGIAALAAVMILFGTSPKPVEAATTLLVTTNANSGPGSFRAAVDQANSNSSVNVIKFLVAGPINLQTSVVYTNSQSLTLSGLFKTVVQGTGSVPVSVTGDCEDYGLFTSTGGGNLTVLSMTFRNASCGSGIRVMIPDVDRTVNITLNGVLLQGNDRHGMWVTESDESYCADSSASASADASINLTVWSSTFANNGGDGLRVHENGYGNLDASVRFSTFRDNGTDGDEDWEGLELVEHCDGDLTLNVLTSTFNGNDSDGLYVSESGEGGTTINLTGIDASGNGNDGVDLQENDEEVEPEGFANESSDLEGEEPEGETETASASDGPEAASCGSGGSLTVTVNSASASGNGDVGFEIDEDGCGDIDATFNAVVASNNEDDGFDVDETSGGDLNFTASATTADFNGWDDSNGDGIELAEAGYGNLTVDLTNVALRFNGSGYDDESSADGLDILEENDGHITLTVKLAVILSNADDGVEINENGCGDLDATFLSSTVSLNAEDGIDAYQDDCGSDSGELTLIFTSVVANIEDDLELDGVVLN